MAIRDPRIGTSLPPGTDYRYRFDINPLLGTDGNDTLVGGAGDESMAGGKGDDTLVGGGGNDRLDGGTGDDKLFGQDGDDVFTPGAGLDQIYGGSLFGDSGNDTVSYANYGGGVVVNLTSGYGYQKALGKDADRDDLHGIENVVGSSFDDTLNGDAKVNRIIGNAGNDTLYGWQGDDHLDGGDGEDHLHGDQGNDTLIGGADDDELYGIEGADILDGGAGDDDLHGGSEADILTGGSGADTFHIAVTGNNGAWGRDTITDFSGQDVIMLEGFFAEPIFLGEQAFGTAAVGQIRYEHPQEGGTLIQVDFEGNGSVDKEIFLSTAVPLTADDFSYF
ncbi:MAG: calcium-binding protein [Parvibaculaceae bacterium]